MKKAIILATVFLFSLGMASVVFAADSAKIGSVDVQKVLLLSNSGKDAKELLAQKANKYEAEKNAKDEELKKLKADLEKQSVLLSESARSSKERDYQQRLKEYQRFLKDAQDDLQSKNDELTNRIVDEIVKVTQDFARRNGYTVIFVRNETMIYLEDKADLTDQILKLFNESKKK
ncbi:OmpH family outer membrane protein [Geotalea sp. SG265]|uniref:OmpH family outer membrane protein n=1 Tax=Geotalea sp. SG265 TaxID=2922867 RepID=UPI001FAEE130|nr:OmpH family outer membrane protein [Geotalea sp. SG265]